MTRRRKVLVVDDETAMHRFLTPALEATDHDVTTATTGAEALRRGATGAPDVILLDLGLPDMDGKEVLRRLRAFSAVPVIVLSARDREAEKIEALDLGADDYVNKPFGIGELLARMRVALRHARGESHETNLLQVGGVVIDVPAHRVTRAGEDIKLTPKEFDLLVVLARGGGKMLTHRHILAAVWGPAHVDDTQYLRVFVGQLRAKLERDPSNPELILTEPGIGYRVTDTAVP